MKIFYLLPGGLYNSGGMERVISIKANYLAENYHYDVSIVTTEQMGRPLFFPLSEKVHLHHLDIGIHENFGKETYLEKIRSRYAKTKEYRKKLEALLYKERPDITISVLGLEIDFINQFKDGSIKVGELHFPGNFRELTARKLSDSYAQNLIAKFRTRQLRRNARKLSRLVVLTREEKSTWDRPDNITVIPNPLSFCPEEKSPLQNKQAIAVGRLAYEKGFDMLVEAWRLVADKHPDWKLNIFGSGTERDKLLNQIHASGLEGKVAIHAPTSDIYRHYLDHSMILFSSRYLDALPMVLLEAQSCGLPIVSFDAPCGPKDVVTDGTNGFLVATGDVETLAAKVNQLVDDDALRVAMGEAAKSASANYQVEKIMDRWVQLFQALRNEDNSHLGH